MNPSFCYNQTVSCVQLWVSSRVKRITFCTCINLTMTSKIVHTYFQIFLQSPVQACVVWKHEIKILLGSSFLESLLWEFFKGVRNLNAPTSKAPAHACVSTQQQWRFDKYDVNKMFAASKFWVCAGCFFNHKWKTFSSPISYFPLSVTLNLKQHYGTTLPSFWWYSCLVMGWMGSLSLVSCNFSERLGSKRYIHVYFNIHIFMTLLQTWDLYLRQWCCILKNSKCRFQNNAALINMQKPHEGPST